MTCSRICILITRHIPSLARGADPQIAVRALGSLRVRPLHRPGESILLHQQQPTNNQVKTLKITQQEYSASCVRCCICILYYETRGTLPGAPPFLKILVMCITLNIPLLRTLREATQEDTKCPRDTHHTLEGDRSTSSWRPTWPGAPCRMGSCAWRCSHADPGP